MHRWVIARLYFLQSRSMVMFPALWPSSLAFHKLSFSCLLWTGRRGVSYLYSFRLLASISSAPLLVSKGCITNYHKPSGLKQWEFILSQLLRILNSRCGQGHTPSEGARTQTFHASSSFRGSDVPWLGAAHLQPLPLLLHGLLSCMSEPQVSFYLPLIRIPVIGFKA